MWDGCSEQDKTALERFQNEAARSVTGLTRSTSIANLYKECGWDSLAKRRQFQKMCLMYKCSNDLVPDYISDIIPPLVGEVYVIVKILQMYIPVQKFHADLASLHLCLAGTTLVTI